MTERTMQPTGLEIATPGGKLHAHGFGPTDGRLVLCVHGLSANSRSFDFIAERLAEDGRRVVALDLRGRGRSAVTARGTYGWLNHARDVLAAADALGASEFDCVGHSMGAFVGLQTALLAPERIGKVVLIDGAGVPEASSLPPILTSAQRLGRTFASADEYVRTVQSIGTVAPWSEYWEDHFRYDLVDAPGGVRAGTDRDAVFEDVAYATCHNPRSFWETLTTAALLVRAARPLHEGAGYIVSLDDRDAFVRTARNASAVEIDANHYGIMTHPRTARAIRRFLS